jgi:hypothetical protein
MSRKPFQRSAVAAFAFLAAVVAALTGSADFIPLMAANFPPRTPES